MNNPAFDLTSFGAAIAERGIFIVDGAIDDLTRNQLLDEAKRLRDLNAFRAAKIGKGLTKRLRTTIRSDLICWLDDWSPPPLAVAKVMFDDLLLTAKRQMFLPLKRYESHFVLYPRGAYYKKHVDQHAKNPCRILSCVLYLGDWQPGNGGELLLHHGEECPPDVIQPLPGRLVVFESRIVHEVRPTNVKRWSLTTWFRDDLDPNLNFI